MLNNEEGADVELYIRIGGVAENISAETFFKVGRGFFEVMKDVDRTLHDGKPSVKWEIVNLAKNSPATITFGAAPVMGDLKNSILARSTFLDGLKSIQNSVVIRPRGWSDAALKKVRDIITKLPIGESALSIGTISTVPVNLTIDAVAQIDKWIGVKYQSVGSIEGRLENVASHKNKNQCAIFDDLGRKIDCSFGEKLKPDIKDGLFDRVSIRGTISYRSDDVPIAISATKIERVTIEESAQDPRRFMGTWNMEMTSNEYVEALHDE